MKTLKFQHWIVASTSLLVLVLSAGFLFTVFGKFRETARTGAIEKFSLIAEGVSGSLQGDLTNQARRALIVASTNMGGAIRRGQLPLSEAMTVLGTALRQYPALYSEYMGLSNGDFIQAVAVRNDAAIINALSAPAGTETAQRVIQTAPTGQRIESWQFLGPDNVVLGQRQAPTTYQPLERPWYLGAQKAEGAYLTQPYLFSSTQNGGMTVSAAMPNQSGVYGIDISFHVLPRLLSSYLASDNAFIGIVDEQNRLLGANGKGNAVSATKDKPLTPLAQSSDERLRSLAGSVSSAHQDNSSVIDFNGQAYVVALRALTIAAGGHYTVITWAPVSDFTALVELAQRDVLLLSGGLLLLLIPLSFFGTRGVARSLANMALDSERLRQLDFSAEPQKISSYLYEIDALGKAQGVMHRSIRERTAALELAQAKLGRIVETGIDLGREQNRENMLQKALIGTRDIAHCQMATLFLKTERNTLSFAYRTSDDVLPSFELPLYDEEGAPIHKFVATHVALTGETVVIGNIYDEHRFDVSGTKKFSEESGIRVVSMLNVPLTPQEGKIIGVIQLLNALDPATGEVIAFDPEIVRFVEALAAQAAVALENQNLLDAQKALMEATIKLIAGAIDTKSPYTGNHCERVPELAMLLAQAACEVQEGPLADFSFKTDDEWREFRIGAWLHDCGKVTTPEFVVDKATKLETIYNRIHEIRMRFEVLLRDADIQRLQAIHEQGVDHTSANARFAETKAALIDDFAFVAECNLGGEFMADDRLDRLRKIALYPWRRHFDDQIGLSQDELIRHRNTPPADLPALESLLSDKPHHLFERLPSNALSDEYGFKLKVPEHLYNQGEVYNLSVRRGTLTEEDRFKINEHVIQSIVMLEQMPLPPNLKRVPEYAGTHHETLVGTGYPRRLEGKDLSVPSRIMAIADIFEALTASDRPYKKPKTLSESIKILSFFKKDHHIDPVLFDLFLSSGIYRTYAEKFLAPDQIDDVDVSAYLG